MNRELANTRVVLSFENKLKEMEFFFHMVELEWKATLDELTQRGQLRDGGNLDRINHYFSAFSNSFQSIKDILHVITGPVPWNTFSSIKYFYFIKWSRNAITHDGLWLISTFTNGKYYVSHAGGQLVRYNNGQEIPVECPSEDIVTICREFFSGLLKEIISIISKNESAFYVNSKDYTVMVREAVAHTNAIPEFAKNLLAEHSVSLDSAVEAMGNHDSRKLLGKIKTMICKLNVSTPHNKL
ncbi:MAG: hypothetical protein ABIN99_12865 [Nitrosospira sp.]